jgi:hypothetical protein
MRRSPFIRLEVLAWGFALVVAILPLWVSHELPLVDLPQHEYVLAVLGQVDDPATLYPRYFEVRPGIRPYLGYYVVVGLLDRWMSIDVANRIFLSIVVAALPLSLAFLLRSLGRAAWPGLLSIPFAFGDAFGWGYVNYCASLPLLFASLGLWVRALADARGRRGWLAGLIVCLPVLVMTHPVPVACLAVGFPFLLLTTPVPEDATAWGIGGRLRARIAPLAILACGALGAAVYGVRVALRSHSVSDAIARGDWSGLLAQRHFEFRPPLESLRVLPDLFANLLRDGSDHLGPIAAGLVALAAVAAARVGSGRAPRPEARGFERVRPLGLVVSAAALYLALPLHVYGSIGDVSPRFAPVIAALGTGLVPGLGGRTRALFLCLAAAVSLATAVPLIRGFRAFDREAAPLREVIAAVGDRPTLMGLIDDPESRVMRHPVYLHAAATAARARGGIPHYTLADWPNGPIRHRTAAPPSYPDEWHPERFDRATMAPAYDHFLGRGRTPEVVFGESLGRELHVAARAGEWWLVRRGR